MEKNIFKIIKQYLKYWYLFVIGVIICVVFAFFHVRYNITPEYYIGGQILLNDKEEGGGLQSFNNLGLIKESDNVQDEIGVLRSFDLMKQTIDELGFAVGYYVEGSFDEIEIYGNQVPFEIVLNDSLPLHSYGELGQIIIENEFSFRIEKQINDDNIKKSTYQFGEIIDSEFGLFQVNLKDTQIMSNDPTPILVRFKNPTSVAMGYNAKIEVYPVNDAGSGLLQLGLTDAIPSRGKDLINKLIDVYAKNSAESKNFLANSTLKLIDERLELLTGELNAAEKDVETFKQNNDLTSVESDAARFIALADDTERELAELRIQINALNSLESSVTSSIGTFAAISAFNIQDPILLSSIQTYNNEVQRRMSIINATGSGNPMLPEIDSQLRQTKNLIAQNVSSIKVQLARTQKELLNKLSQYRSRKSSVPSAERALLEINRDQGIKNNLYLFLLQKREEEALSISVPFSDIRVIEQPQATGYPVTGAKTPVYLGAILLGLFVPFAFVFVKDMMNTKILTKEDIESKTATPIIGKISENHTKDVVVVSSSSVSPIAELFRLMRHNLKFLAQNKEDKVMMVTSSKQGEGKTFISINLASSLALTNKKVVVVGFDLRVPKLMKDVNVNYEKGLSDFIVDSDVSPEEIINEYEKQNNMFFIGAGAIPPNPGELMLSPRVADLIEYLKENFDYVILDTPPIGKVADAYSLASFVDSTLFVVRHNYTKKEELEIINEISENHKLDTVMIVYNGVKLEKSSGVYSYGYGNKN